MQRVIDQHTKHHRYMGAEKHKVDEIHLAVPDRIGLHVGHFYQAAVRRSCQTALLGFVVGRCKTTVPNKVRAW
jgi:hypothetical protein